MADIMPIPFQCQVWFIFSCIADVSVEKQMLWTDFRNAALYFPCWGNWFLCNCMTYANPEGGSKQHTHCSRNRNLTPQVECYRLKSNTTTLSLSFSQELVRWWVGEIQRVRYASRVFFSEAVRGDYSLETYGSLDLSVFLQVLIKESTLVVEPCWQK